MRAMAPFLRRRSADSGAPIAPIVVDETPPIAGLDARDVIVTGVSRSGTSYLCNLLHRFDNCVAINEPSEMISVLRAEEVPVGVAAYYGTLRRDILAGKPIHNKLRRGQVVEDTARHQKRRRTRPQVNG